MKKHIQKSLTLLDCRPKILFQKESTEGFSKEAQEKIAEEAEKQESVTGTSVEQQEKTTENKP